MLIVGSIAGAVGLTGTFFEIGFFSEALGAFTEFSEWPGGIPPGYPMLAAFVIALGSGVAAIFGRSLLLPAGIIGILAGLIGTSVAVTWWQLVSQDVPVSLGLGMTLSLGGSFVCIIGGVVVVASRTSRRTL